LAPSLLRVALVADGSALNVHHLKLPALINMDEHPRNVNLEVALAREDCVVGEVGADLAGDGGALNVNMEGRVEGDGVVEEVVHVEADRGDEREVNMGIEVGVAGEDRGPCELGGGLHCGPVGLRGPLNVGVANVHKGGGANLGGGLLGEAAESLNLSRHIEPDADGDGANVELEDNELLNNIEGLVDARGPESVGLEVEDNGAIDGDVLEATGQEDKLPHGQLHVEENLSVEPDEAVRALNIEEGVVLVDGDGGHGALARRVSVEAEADKVVLIFTGANTAESDIAVTDNFVIASRDSNNFDLAGGDWKEANQAVKKKIFTRDAIIILLKRGQESGVGGCALLEHLEMISRIEVHEEASRVNIALNGGKANNVVQINKVFLRYNICGVVEMIESTIAAVRLTADLFRYLFCYP